MSLTHVCIWESGIGFRKISINEACSLFDVGVPANKGIFVCELCSQNVLLTSPGINARHFRHDSETQTKECTDRQKLFDQTYGRSIVSLNSNVLPLKISIDRSNISFYIGFFNPPDNKSKCEKINIMSDNNHTYTYSYDRLTEIGITYLQVGTSPSKYYNFEYIKPEYNIDKYWPKKIPGIHPEGSFFSCNTGKLIPLGGKTHADSDYFLLQIKPLYSVPSDIEVTEITRTKSTSNIVWYLYRIHIKKFSKFSAQFFLKYSIFLTENPTKFYPIWPNYIHNPNFIYHNSDVVYFYLTGMDAELKSFPAAENVITTDDGKLYKLKTRDREQLVSFGKFGALGFSYLIKQYVNKETTSPEIKIIDCNGMLLTENDYLKLPKSNLIVVSAPFDGKAIVKKNDKTVYIYKLSSDTALSIENLTFGTEILIYQGCDCVRELRFILPIQKHDNSLDDEYMFHKLDSCCGDMIPIAHSFGSIISKFSKYPKTKQWIRRIVRNGEISRNAYRILLNHVEKHIKSQ